MFRRRRSHCVGRIKRDESPDDRSPERLFQSTMVVQDCSVRELLAEIRVRRLDLCGIQLLQAYRANQVGEPAAVLAVAGERPIGDRGPSVVIQPPLEILPDSDLVGADVDPVVALGERLTERPLTVALVPLDSEAAPLALPGDRIAR